MRPMASAMLPGLKEERTSSLKVITNKGIEKMIRIKCDGPSPVEGNCSITDKSGHALEFVSKINIIMEASKANRAIIDIDTVDFIDVEAEPMLSLESIKAMAEYYGAELVWKKEGEDKALTKCHLCGESFNTDSMVCPKAGWTCRACFKEDYYYGS
jgi:hypothetical protein